MLVLGLICSIIGIKINKVFIIALLGIVSCIISMVTYNILMIPVGSFFEKIELLCYVVFLCGLVKKGGVI